MTSYLKSMASSVAHFSTSILSPSAASDQTSAEEIVDVYKTIPIKSSNSQIRVLEILPGIPGSKVCARLVLYSLDEDHVEEEEFDALSYTWGSELPQHAIQLNQDGNFKVRSNLFEALTSLRRLLVIQRIWIDALCINQNDILERSEQVQLMRKIYGEAREVIIWLDQDIQFGSQALLKLRTFNENSTEDDLGNHRYIYEPLTVIFDDPYWKRVWIQQEISNATKLRIQCRKVCLSTFNVFHFIRITDLKARSFPLLTYGAEEWLALKPAFKLPPRFGSRSSSPESPRGSTFSQQDWTLLQILGKSYRLQCTDARDRLFGLLSIACDYQQGDIPVNYELGIHHAYAAFPRFYLKKYGSLDFLLYAGLDWISPEKDREIPSWIPDWRGPSPRMDRARHTNPAVLPSSLRTASETLLCEGDTLPRVQGFPIDTIVRIATPRDQLSRDYTSLKTILSICNYLMTEASARQPPSFSTDHVDLFGTPLWKSLALTLCTADNQRIRGGEFNSALLDTMWNDAKDFENAYRAHVASTAEFGWGAPMVTKDLAAKGNRGHSFWVLTHEAMTKHSPFVGERGDFGMCLKSAKVGDEIWIILGCAKPLLLRKEGDNYIVVGEVYYNGANWGEYLENIPEDVEPGDVVSGHTVQALTLC